MNKTIRQNARKAKLRRRHQNRLHYHNHVHIVLEGVQVLWGHSRRTIPCPGDSTEGFSEEPELESATEGSLSGRLASLLMLVWNVAALCLHAVSCFAPWCHRKMKQKQNKQKTHTCTHTSISFSLKLIFKCLNTGTHLHHSFLQVKQPRFISSLSFLLSTRDWSIVLCS